MTNEEAIRERDDVRMEFAIRTVKDVLLRFEESSEGTRSVYEAIGYLLQDLVSEGMCPACLSEAIAQAFTESGADTERHLEDGDAIRH